MDTNNNLSTISLKIKEYPIFVSGTYACHLSSWKDEDPK